MKGVMFYDTRCFLPVYLVNYQHKLRFDEFLSIVTILEKNPENILCLYSVRIHILKIKQT